MTAFTNLNWPEVLAVIVISIICGLVFIVLLTRNPRQRHLKVGFFVEREDHQDGEGPTPEEEKDSKS